MTRRTAAIVLLAAAWSGCSLVVDTGDLASGAGIPAGGSAPEAGAGADASAGVDAKPDVEAGPCSIDLTTDPKNCGRCGHDCLGGACTLSQCQATIVVQGESDIAGVAVDATDIYWSKFGGQIRTAHLDGTEIKTVGQLSAACHIKVDETWVYVATFGKKTIERIRKNGTSAAPELLAPCFGECLGVAVGGGRVYFSDRGNGALRRVESDGGATSLVLGLDGPEDLSAGPTRILLANEGADHVLAHVYGSKVGTAVATVRDPVATAEDASDIWTVSQAPRTIVRTPLGTTVGIVAATSPARPIGLALSPTAVYWVGDDGTIHRLAK